MRSTTLDRKPLYRYNAAQRVDSARMYLDADVDVVEHPGRWAEKARIVSGRLIAVTASPTANCAELIVIRVPGQKLDTAISLANVADIRRR